MTQIYLEDGTAVPVTVVQAGPCHVLQVRDQERDGYQAVQLGFEDKPRRLAIRSVANFAPRAETFRHFDDVAAYFVTTVVERRTPFDLNRMWAQLRHYHRSDRSVRGF